ncbi:MAG: SDR family oxidoreductase [Pseudomonadota bacterium]
MFDVAGRVACVTGASSGLGRAAATALAKRGARVVAVARRERALQEWQQSCSGETAILVADLSKVDEIGAIAEQASAPFGPPQILINAAGINTREAADVVTHDGWDRTLALNLSAPFFLAQSLAPAMKERRWGRIVNFASLQSRRAFPGGITYGASKGGIEQLTRAMAEAWSADGVIVNALAPGFFPTELTGPVFADAALAERNAQQTCLGRNGRLDDLEGPLVFLCSDASAYVTGQVLFVDGGFTAK